MSINKTLTRDAVRRYIEVNGLFTVGNNHTYAEMFGMIDRQMPIHDIATVIWVCSDEDKTGKSADVIELDLLRISQHEEV